MNRIIVVAMLFAACGVESPAEEESFDVVEGEARRCPSSRDPKVHYINRKPSVCAATLFQCTASQITFNDGCGCGCIDRAAPGCPDPSASNVRYISQRPSTCAASLFQCRPGESTFNDSCGCGCIASPPPPPSSCPSASDPKVHFISPNVTTCAAALFQCAPTQTTFNNSCGCGCID